MPAALHVAVLVLFPALALYAVRRVPPLRALGEVVLCYAFGLLLANIGLSLDTSLSKSAAEAAVPLAIPLLLLTTDIPRWLRLARATLLSFVLAIVSVVVVSSAAAAYFRHHVDRAADIAGMLVGVYTGGTPNMSAIGLALDVPEETFILMNAADTVLGGAWLLFLLSFARRAVGLFLPPFKPVAAPAHEPESDAPPTPSRHRLPDIALAGALGAGALAVAAGLSLALLGRLAPGLVILTITTLGIAGSFVPALRRLDAAYGVGHYLLLIFCVAVGTLADVRALLAASPTLFIYVAVVMFGAVTLHLALAAVLRIDADTTLITSAAAIYGPAFIGPVAGALRNRELVVSGLTTSLVGIAAGNYLGLALAWLLAG